MSILVSRHIPKAKDGKGLSGFFRIGSDVVKEAGWPEGTKEYRFPGTQHLIPT